MKFTPSLSPNQSGLKAAENSAFLFDAVDRVLRVATIIVLIGLVFYVYSRGFISLSADEFAKAVYSWDGLNKPVVWLKNIWLPGQFPLIALAYTIVGDLLTASRLVSWLFGTLTILGMYRLGRQIGTGRIGGLTALLCATQPLVVWLSATGLADILYAAPLVLGLSYYLQPQRSDELRPFYLACVLFSVSCVFHYNGWMAVAIIALGIGYDLIRGRGHPRLHLLLGLCILGIVPMGWIILNGLQSGDLLAFWHMHTINSAPAMEASGYQPSVRNALLESFEWVFRYQPVLFALALGSAAGITTHGEKDRNGLFLWFVLLAFGTGVIVLYAIGGHPTAYSERYFLIPSLLAAALAAQALSKLLLAQEQYVRLFAGLLLGAAIMANLWVTLHRPTTHKRIEESVAVAEYIKSSGLLQRSDRILFETKPWNGDVIRVFLNNPNAIVDDRSRESHYESILMNSENEIRRFAKERGIGLIAVYSNVVRAHVNTWNLRTVGDIESYTIYDLN